MKRSTRELGKRLKEDGDEGVDILCGVFGSFDDFPVIRVREANPNTIKLLSIKHALTEWG